MNLYLNNGNEHRRQKEKSNLGEKNLSKLRINWLKDKSFHKGHEKGHLHRDCLKSKFERQLLKR